jgi:hypothetical protein
LSTTTSTLASDISPCPQSAFITLYACPGTLVDRHEHEVVEPALGGHVVVHDLGHGELEQRQEDPLGGVAEVVVLHRRLADDVVAYTASGASSPR